MERLPAQCTELQVERLLLPKQFYLRTISICACVSVRFNNVAYAKLFNIIRHVQNVLLRPVRIIEILLGG